MIEIVCADLHAPPVELLGAFGVVMSYGVEEHFTDLEGVIAAIARFAKLCFVFFNMTLSLSPVLVAQYGKGAVSALGHA